MRMLLSIIVCFLLLAPRPATAHPHAWVTLNTTIIVNDKNQAVAIRERWLFDKMYSVYALDDFDPNKNGTIDNDELVQLATENVTSLKEYNYFTVVEGTDGKPVTFGAFKDVASSFLEQDGKPIADKSKVTEKTSRQPDGTLKTVTEIVVNPEDAIKNTRQIIMEFTLPLEKPQDMAKGFSYRIYDPTYYIDMGHDKKNHITFVREGTNTAIEGCTANVAYPKVDEKMIFDAAALDKNATAPKDLGYYFSEKAEISCKLPK